MGRHTERSRGRRVTRIVALVTGAALGVGGAFLWFSPEPAPPPRLGTDGVPVVPTTEVPQPELGNATKVAQGEPTDMKGDWLIVDSVAIKAPIESVGTRPVEAGTEMVIPDDVSQVAWLNTGARPGDLVGASVISGHVSDEVDRPGAMWRLRDVKVGDLVTWVSGGRKWTFVVTGDATYSRAGDLPEEMFDNGIPRTLYLVTCAGRRDLGNGHFTYEENLVLKAELYGTMEAIPISG